MSFLVDIVNRITILEKQMRDLQDSLSIAIDNAKNLSEQMDDASKAQYALQIATMLAMLRMAGADEKKIDNDLRSYLKMGKFYAKEFINIPDEEDPWKGKTEGEK